MVDSVGDGYYYLRFDINGAQQVGYAQFSPDNTVLRGIGYQPAVFVADVPEPATWMQLILGFGVVGAASRRVRRARRNPQLASA